MDSGPDSRRIKTQSQFHPPVNHWSVKLYIPWMQTYANLRMFFFFMAGTQSCEALNICHPSEFEMCLRFAFSKEWNKRNVEAFFFPEHYACVLRFWPYHSACCYLFGCPPGRCCSNSNTTLVGSAPREPAPCIRSQCHS